MAQAVISSSLHPTIWVEVDTGRTGLHQFRHASELNKEAKGGYLMGTVRVCGLREGTKIRELTLCLVIIRFRSLASLS